MKTTSLNELVFEILELLRANLKITDPINRRLVIDWIQSNRALLLRNRLAKPFSYPPDSVVQDIGSFTLTNVVPISYNYSINKFRKVTTNEVPKPLFMDDGVGLFTRIGPTEDLYTNYGVYPREEAIHRGYGVFNTNRVHAYYMNDKLYLVMDEDNYNTLSSVNIQGVFQDPIAAAKIVNPSWTYDDDYPIDKSTIDSLKSMIINGKFQLSLSQLTDTKEGDYDNPTTNVRGSTPTINQNKK